MSETSVLFSESTLRFAKRNKIDVNELRANVELRKQTVDAVFTKLLSKVLLLPPTASDYDIPVKPELSLGSTFVGRIVALLSTGETGVVVDKPDRKCIVRMDRSGDEIKVTWEELFWLKRCSGPQDAVEQIIKASCFVPQVRDLKIGIRVAIVRLQFQTAVVVKLPESRKNCCFTLELEHSRKIWKGKADGLRLIAASSPIIGPLCSKQGRPKADWVREQKKLRKPDMLVPESKANEEWARSIHPPTVLPPARSANDPLTSDSEDDASDGGGEDNEEGDENDPLQQTEFYL
jgi:hypothetical protein